VNGAMGLRLHSFTTPIETSRASETLRLLRRKKMRAEVEPIPASVC
jgi:hypothetical protein